jgi:hypothetical protein
VPLDPTWRLPAAIRQHPWGFGIWMRIAESDPPSDVWIWVTAECLDQLDPNQVRDIPARAKTLEARRPLIEQSASAKFDGVGLDPRYGMHEECPILLVYSDDVL